MIFVWLFGIKGDYSAALLFSGKRDSALGAITNVEKGFGTQNESEIYAYSYTFWPGGNHYSGVSYSSQHRFAVGDQVAVEFPAENPARSRIAGMRQTPFPALVGLAFVLPALGLFLIGRGFARGRRAHRLLLSGKQNAGKT
jgi:hypothetical protein